MAQVTDKGFISKTQNEYFSELQSELLAIDPEWNLDPSTPDGLKAAKDAEIFGNLDEAVQAAYNSKDPASATGVDLDIICSLTGSQRSLGTPSSVTLTLSGVAGTVIPSGSLVDSGINTTQWAIDSSATIGAGGTVSATATCQTNGATEANPNTITRIVNTVGGWQSVTNPDVPTLGTDAQSDPSLRIERALSVGRSGNNQTDSMIGELFAVSGVRRVRVYENNKSAVDANGLPANSIAPIIDGGDNADIAKAIFIKKAAGCQLFAAGTAVTVNDVYDQYPSNTATITFSRPIYVDQVINLTIFNDGTLPANVQDLIKTAVVEYAEGVLLPSNIGFNNRGYDIGQSVPVNQIATPINKIMGQYGYSYIEDLAIQGVTAPVSPIAFNEIARFSAANINITVNS